MKLFRHGWPVAVVLATGLIAPSTGSLSGGQLRDLATNPVNTIIGHRFSADRHQDDQASRRFR